MRKNTTKHVTRRGKRANSARPTAASKRKPVSQAATLTEHTSGPWVVMGVDEVNGVDPDDLDDNALIVASVTLPKTDMSHGEADVICDLWEIKGRRSEVEANARLIAAAPELLAKLKEIFDGMACSCRLQHFVDGPIPCHTCQIGNAIAKAEGR